MGKIKLLPTGIENEKGGEVMQLLRMLFVTVFHFANRSWALMLLILVVTAATSQAQTSRSAVKYLERANDRYAKGDKEGAIADFDIAITFDPSKCRSALQSWNSAPKQWSPGPRHRRLQ
jgi:hypothetical protein